MSRTVGGRRDSSGGRLIFMEFSWILMDSNLISEVLLGSQEFS